MKKSRNGGKRLLKTSAPRPKKRLLGACILFMMVALALVTAVLAAGDTWADSSSYSLVIQKQFAAGTSEEVLKEAKKQTYTFHIEGYRLGENKEEIPIDQYVSIGPESANWTAEPGENGEIRWKVSDTFSSEGPIHVTVTEITNTGTLTVDGKEYSMGDSRAETTTLFTEAPQVRDLNSNGRIVLSRPAKKLDPVTNQDVPVNTTSSFRIRSQWPWDPDEVAQPTGWTEFNETVELSPGREYSWDNLQPGRYTIEDLSVSGYQIKLGERTQTVEAGKDGTFYINSKPGMLKITAGGTAGDGQTHVYRVERTYVPDGAEDFTDRYTDPVASGGTYTLENLPKGQYKVTEYIPPDVPTKFTVKVPETAEREQIRTSSALTSGTANSWKYIDLQDENFDVDYIKMESFGPLYDSKNNRLSSSDKYTAFRYALYAEDGKLYTKDVITYSSKAGYSGYTVYSMNDATKLKVPSSKKIGFTVTGVRSSSAKKIGVSWIEYDEKESTYTPTGAGVPNSYTVDERGWMEITAPAMKDGKNVSYVYTLRKEQDGPVLQTLTLNSGEIGKFEVPKAGTYLLMEEVEQAGFGMAISGGPFGSTVAGNSFDLTVMGNRELTIIKPDNKQDGGRTYSFKVEKLLNSGSVDSSYPAKTVTLKAGENSGAQTAENPKGTNQSITLPAGRYRVTPTDDMTEVFELTCSDSSQVHAQVPSGSSATVTFTNVFTEGNMGYRYVHEYYVKEKENQYRYEGCSPVTTVGGRSDSDETYSSIDVIKEPEFTVGGQTYQYDYMPENNAFGRVVASAPGVGKEGTGGLYTWNQSSEKTADGGGGTPVYYQKDDTLTGAKAIRVTENKSQIIILRYFRVLPEDQKGSYKYVHVYYHRTEDGTEEWEGTSEIKTATGQLGLTYSAPSGTVQLKPKYTPTGDHVPVENRKEWEYEFNGRPSYGRLIDDHTAPHIELYPVSHNPDDPNHYHYIPDSDAAGVTATADGQNIIILRYYRGVVKPPVTETPDGSYKVVHEYYFREKLEDQGPGDAPEGSGDIQDNPGDTQGDPGDTQSGPGDIQNSPGDAQSDPGDTQDGQGNAPVDSEESEIDGQSEDGISPQSDDEEEAEGDSSFSGTLSSDDRYSYTFEGARTVESINAPLGSTHKGDEVEKQAKLKPEGPTYTYYDTVYGKTGGDDTYNYVSNMEWASSTEDGDEIIILRYFREEGGPTTPNPPDKPDQPDKPGGGGGGGGGGKDPDPTPPPEDPKDPPTGPENPPTDPENPPTDPEVPPTDPENPPTDPENPPTDPEHPTELPDPNDPDSPDEITIWENGVPKTYVKVWDPENEVWVYIPEEDVPLWNKVPQTGDESRTELWGALAAASLCGLAGLTLLTKKRKNR